MASIPRLQGVYLLVVSKFGDLVQTGLFFPQGADISHVIFGFGTSCSVLLWVRAVDRD